jgi:VanZ family protein
MNLTLQQKAIRWCLWWLALAAWTAVLLSSRAPAVVDAVVPSALHFWVAKAGHVCTYALLSALAGFMPAGWRSQAALRLLLVCHGAATEYLQTFVPGRTGSVRDVGLDAAGVMLGWAAWWAWRRLRPA